MGRMAEPAEIHAAVVALLGRAGPLAGRRVLVTAGGTREPLDAVRFLGNRSVGRMGVALADGRAARGAEVTTLLVQRRSVRPAGGERRRDVERRRPGARGARARRRGRRRADGRRRRRLPARGRRRRKRARGGAWSLELVPTADILAALGARAAARARCWWASRPRPATASSAPATSASARAST